MYVSYKTWRVFQNLFMSLLWSLTPNCKKWRLCLSKKKNMQINISASFLTLYKPDPIKHKLSKLPTPAMKRDLSKKAHYQMGKYSLRAKVCQTNRWKQTRRWETNIHRRGKSNNMILLIHSRVRRRMYSWITKQTANGLSKNTDLVVNMKVRHSIPISIPCQKERKLYPATT